MAKKVLVLGGTGFVGAHVARVFQEAGHEVAVGTRSPATARARCPDAEPVACDLRDRGSLERACAGRDVVVHAAGALSLWPRQNEALFGTNVLGTRNVVEACLAADVGRLVYAGSAGVYAGSVSPAPVDEDGALSTERYHSFHVVSMALAEAEVFKGVARGLRAVLLHPSLCFGYGDHRFHSSWVIACLATTRMAFAPPGGLNVVDVVDVARVHLAAAEKGPEVEGRSYLIGGENLTNRAFLDLLSGVLGVRGLNLSPSRSALRGLGRLFSTVARVTGQDRGNYITLNEHLAQAMTLYWFIDCGRAHRELDYASSPAGPAIARQVEWLRSAGHLPAEGISLPTFVGRFLHAPPDDGMG